MNEPPFSTSVDLPHDASGGAAEAIRAELRTLEVALLNLWVDVISVQPILAEHLRAAARFTHNAIVTLDAGAGTRALVPRAFSGDPIESGVIDLRSG